jgi:hypothetical protein
VTAISVGGTEVIIRPARLIDYVEKLDFIKMRRTSPYDLVRDFPREDAKGSLALVEIAMRTVYTNSSNVSVEEELAFDKSEEGFYWTLWRCMPAKVSKSPEDWRAGINRAKMLWESGTPDERRSLRFAMDAVDEMANLKNSEGPKGETLPGQHQESPQPSSTSEPEEASLPA